MSESNNNKYKFLVATDMDYTLLLPGQPISQENKDAIRLIKQAGGAFTLATGRTSFLTGAYIDELELEVPIITSNGASLFDPVAYKEIYASLIPEEIVRALIRVFIKNNTNATGYCPEAIYYAPGSLRREFIANYNKSVPDKYKAPTAEITADMIEGDVPVFNKFLLVEPDEEALNFAYTFKDLEIVSSAPGFYDIMYKGSTKGDALLRTADFLGIPRENTFALGDSDNDLSMLQAAKYAIAMGNANDLIKGAATYITDTCENHGLAKAIRDYIIPLSRELS